MYGNAKPNKRNSRVLHRGCNAPSDLAHQACWLGGSQEDLRKGRRLQGSDSLGDTEIPAFGG